MRESRERRGARERSGRGRSIAGLLLVNFIVGALNLLWPVEKSRQSVYAKFYYSASAVKNCQNALVIFSEKFNFDESGPSVFEREELLFPAS